MPKKKVSAKWKTYIRVICAGLAALLLLAVVIVATQVEDITLTEAQIQEKISAKLPMQKKGINVNDIGIKLTSAIGVDFDVDGQKYGQKFAIKAFAAGKIRYENGSFYLTPLDLKISNLELQGKSMDEVTQKAADGALKALHSKALNEEIDDQAKKRGVRGGIGRFLQMKRDQAKKIDPAVAMAAIKPKLEKATIAVAKFGLAKIPVYTLPDDLKGKAVQMTLKGITVENGMLTAHLSFWAIGFTVFFLGGFALLFIALLFTAPRILGYFFEFVVEAGSVVAEIADV